MFETLTSKLEGIFNNLKKAPSLNKAQVETGLKEIRQALLAADVALPVVKKFIEDIANKIKENPMGEGTEYNIYPPNLKDPYESRRREVGRSMYEVLNIPKEDKAGRLNQFKRNFEFFGAPVAIFFAIDRQMQEGQWSDLGMFMQSIMLLAREEGLHTAPQEAWAIWYKTVNKFLDIPKDLMLFCGMGIGYADEDDPINTFRSKRADIDEFTNFIGF